MLREFLWAVLMGVTLFCVMRNTGELGGHDIRASNISDVLFVASVWSERQPSEPMRVYVNDVGDLRPEFLMGNWSSSDAYYPTDTVFYRRALWMATEANVNSAPDGENQTCWRPLLLFGSAAGGTVFQKYDMVLDIAATMAVYMCNTARCVSSSTMDRDARWKKMGSQTDVLDVMYSMTERRDQEKANGESAEQLEEFMGGFMFVSHLMVLAMHNDLKTAVLSSHQHLQAPLRVHG